MIQHFYGFAHTNLSDL